MRRVLLAAWLWASAGCAAEQRIESPAEVVVHERLAVGLARLLDPQVSQGFEMGGCIVNRGGRLQMQPVPNAFVSLLEYLGEFRQGQYAKRDEFYGLLRGARGVHVRNGSAGLVHCIDEMLRSESQPALVPEQIGVYKTICQVSILPHTYRPIHRVSDALFWFHTHPSGGGPSKYDREVNAGRLFGVVSREPGSVRLYLVRDEMESVHTLESTDVIARR